MRCNVIENTLTEIKIRLGLNLKPYDGILKTFNGTKYFDVELKYDCWNSAEYDKLLKYSNQYKSFRIEQTGYKRLGIFLNK